MLEGTVRTYDVAAQDTIERRMREILDGVTRAGGGRYELDYQRTSPATINDPRLTRRMVPSLQRAVGPGNVIEVPPTMGAEDFAFFAREVPGFYFRLGTVDPVKGSGGHHTPTFMADDAAIPIGIRAMATLVLDYLAEGEP
jgi:amidohydrolase